MTWQAASLLTPTMMDGMAQRRKAATAKRCVITLAEWAVSREAREIAHWKSDEFIAVGMPRGRLPARRRKWRSPGKGFERWVVGAGGHRARFTCHHHELPPAGRASTPTSMASITDIARGHGRESGR